MGLCPICGRAYCDHTPEERGQSPDELLDFSEEDIEAFKTGNDELKKRVARKNLTLEKRRRAEELEKHQDVLAKMRDY